MSFLATIEADLQALWERLRDDEHPAAEKAEAILNDVKAEAEKDAKTVEAEAEPAVEAVAESVKEGAEAVVETAAEDVAKDV